MIFTSGAGLPAAGVGLSIKLAGHSVVGRLVTTRERVMVRAHMLSLNDFLFSRKD
jgi:hypothetical protein